MCNAKTVVIIIIIQINYSLMVNYKVRVSRKKQQTKSRQALITNQFHNS